MLLLSALITLAWWVVSGQAYATLLAWLLWVDGVGLAGAPLLVGVQAVIFLLAMPLWPVELAAGFIYGFWVGVPVACLAYAVGCVAPLPALAGAVARASVSANASCCALSVSRRGCAHLARLAQYCQPHQQGA